MSENNSIEHEIEGNFNPADEITLWSDINPEKEEVKVTEPERTAEELIEYASLFVFVPVDSSKGLDENREEYDYSFVTENGRVAWEKNEDGDFLVEFLFTSDGLEKSEKRILPVDKLKEWFYNPTTKFYQENIVHVPIQ